MGFSVAHFVKSNSFSENLLKEKGIKTPHQSNIKMIILGLVDYISCPVLWYSLDLFWGSKRRSLKDETMSSYIKYCVKL